jgi:hypothetical protein
MNWSAMLIPYSDPAQAAETSKAKARLAPSLACTTTAQDGSGISAEIVATIRMSTSSALVPAMAKACLAATTAMSEVTSPSAAIRLSLIPVRSAIQASLVATIVSRSRLVRIRFGA